MFPKTTQNEYRVDGKVVSEWRLVLVRCFWWETPSALALGGSL